MNALINIKEIKEKTKGQKIVAAVYLVTNHMSDTDPLKETLRRAAIALLSSGSLQHEKGELLQDLLAAAALAGVISEKNASIISYETKKLYEVEGMRSEIRPEFFDTAETSFDQKRYAFKKTSTVLLNQPKKQSMSFSDHVSVLNNKMNNDLNNKTANRTERGDAIMSFMTHKKSATVKDISTLFPGVSEKTVQRELGALVAQGKLSKRGDKRWSVYLLTNLS